MSVKYIAYTTGGYEGYSVQIGTEENIAKEFYDNDMYYGLDELHIEFLALTDNYKEYTKIIEDGGEDTFELFYKYFTASDCLDLAEYSRLDINGGYPNTHQSFTIVNGCVEENETP